MSLVVATSDGRLCDQGVRSFARKPSLTDAKLVQAARDVMVGRKWRRRGRGVFKQRVTRGGGGKSGDSCTFMLFRAGGHSLFAHGLAKNDKTNVPSKALKASKQLADVLLGFSDMQLQAAKVVGELTELVSNGNDKEKG